METIESWTVNSNDINGLYFHVEVVPDEDCTPDLKYDKNMKGLEQVKASWSRDEWRFVGVIVTPVFKGLRITSAEDSLWGTEWGEYPGNSIGREVFEADYPLPDMISVVMHNLRDGASLPASEDEERRLIKEANANLITLGDLKRKLQETKEA